MTAEAWPLDRPAPRQVRAALIAVGDVIRIPGGRAAEVQHAGHDGGEDSWVRLDYLECKSGEPGALPARSGGTVTLLRSSGMRAA
jgi:hypothetical protein